MNLDRLNMAPDEGLEETLEGLVIDIEMLQKIHPIWRNNNKPNDEISYSFETETLVSSQVITNSFTFTSFVRFAFDLILTS